MTLDVVWQQAITWFWSVSMETVHFNTPTGLDIWILLEWKRESSKANEGLFSSAFLPSPSIIIGLQRDFSSVLIKGRQTGLRLESIITALLGMYKSHCPPA